MASSSDKSFPDLPKSKIVFPSNPTLEAAFDFSKQNCAGGVHNHAVRSAYFALLLAAKMPQYASNEHLDLEAVVLSCVLHDMGMADTKSLLSKDKRFEVDGANIARDFIHLRQNGEAIAPSAWDKHRVQLLWDAVALHAVASFALHKEPEVALVHLGVMADFAGPAFPGGLITLEEYLEIVGRFPRRDFNVESMKQITCGLCRDKPETTFDTFIGQFGLAFGTDGKGGGKEEYRAKFEEASPVGGILAQLAYLEKLETGESV